MHVAYAAAGFQFLATFRNIFCFVLVALPRTEKSHERAFLVIFLLFFKYLVRRFYETVQARKRNLPYQISLSLY